MKTKNLNNMNWKEVPHLFANGKFEVKLPKHWSFDNTNLTIHTLAEIFREDELSKCTLIARPISDMSDEEKFELYASVKTIIGDSPSTWDEALSEFKKTDLYYHLGFYVYEDDYEENFIKHLISDSKGFLHLLSIGVYPFEQNNPKDVIWRYENEIH